MRTPNASLLRDAWSRTEMRWSPLDLACLLLLELFREMGFKLGHVSKLLVAV